MPGAVASAGTLFCNNALCQATVRKVQINGEWQDRLCPRCGYSSLKEISLAQFEMTRAYLEDRSCNELLLSLRSRGI